MTREEIARVIAQSKSAALSEAIDAFQELARETEAFSDLQVVTVYLKHVRAVADSQLSKLHQDAGNAAEPFFRLAREVINPVNGERPWHADSKDWMVVFSFAGQSITLGDLRRAAAADALERGSQVVDGLGRDVVDRLLTTIQTQASEIEGLKHQVLGRAQEAWKAEQIAGAVLGYPWFKDDQGSFPGATEADGVCIGEHVTSTIVEELADKTKALQSALDEALEVMRPFADVAASYTAGGLSEDLRHGPTLVTESGHLEKLAPKHFFTLRSLYDRLKGRTGA